MMVADMVDGGMVGGVVALEDWADLVVGGDRHVVGRAGTRWVMTGALREAEDTLVRVQWGSGAYRLGRPAATLCPQALATAKDFGAQIGVKAESPAGQR